MNLEKLIIQLIESVDNLAKQVKYIGYILTFIAGLLVGIAFM